MHHALDVGDDALEADEFEHERTRLVLEEARGLLGQVVALVVGNALVDLDLLCLELVEAEAETLQLVDELHELGVLVGQVEAEALLQAGQLVLQLLLDLSALLLVQLGALLAHVAVYALDDIDLGYHSANKLNIRC